MALNLEQSPFFQKQQRIKGEWIVKDAPKFELDSYIANYAGSSHMHRLHHIGSHSTHLALDAYRLAIAQAKQGKNVGAYTLLVEELGGIAAHHPAAGLDAAWVERRTRENDQELDRLEHELKSYRNNLIKESIRMGHEDLGHFFYHTGDYANALKAYGKMREHCTSSKHLADMTLRLVYVNITQQSWFAVQSHLAKLDAAQLKGEEKTKLHAILSACTALSHMALGSFLDAATHFITTPPAYVTVEPVANISWQREVLSANDVAVYGGLCALASMDRGELQDKVLANPDFRTFLELEPHIRRAITLFCNSKYSACLEILEGYRNDYYLDMYLSGLVNAIYGRIRSKSIVQYFIPFSCVTLDEMRLKFPCAERSMEDELVDMINSGTLDARIDLVDHLLVSPPSNARLEVHAHALATARAYDHSLRLRLTRLNMLAAGMEAQGQERNQEQEQQGGEGEKALGVGGEGISASLRGLGSKMGFV